MRSGIIKSNIQITFFLTVHILIVLLIKCFLFQIDVHDGTSFTFANILHTSFNIADWLRFECGIQKSDVVGIFSENSVWYSSIILATWHIGAVCTFFNPMYNESKCTLVWCLVSIIVVYSDISFTQYSIIFLKENVRNKKYFFITC